MNLNTATIADLDTLPRIGETMAQRILDYREAQGRFTSIKDLRNVTGIGDKTFAALQDLITVCTPCRPVSGGLRRRSQAAMRE